LAPARRRTTNHPFASLPLRDVSASLSSQLLTTDIGTPLPKASAMSKDKPKRRKKRLYDVVIVSRFANQWPASAEHWPRGGRELSTIVRGQWRLLAFATAQAFNAAERLNPRGVWAVVRETKRDDDKSSGPRAPKLRR
jgi:hypothetical protein